jgi:putative membrane protein
MRNAMLAAGIAAVTLFTSSSLQAQNASGTDASRTFMKKAIEADLAEIQTGKLAREKGTNEKVKNFGEKLVSDHSANLKKAKSVAQSLGIKPPVSPNSAQKATYDTLNKLAHSRFDREFTERMIEDHKKDIREFQNESKKSGVVADFARQTLPKLRQHLQVAESLNR